MKYKKAYNVPVSPGERKMFRDIKTLKIETRVPEKYLLVDRETGDVWQWGPGNWWRRAEDTKIQFDTKTLTVKTKVVSPKREK